MGSTLLGPVSATDRVMRRYGEVAYRGRGKAPK